MMINLTDMKTVRSILSRHGFHFSKKLGQNFLVDRLSAHASPKRETLRRDLACWRSDPASAH